MSRDTKIVLGIIVGLVVFAILVAGVVAVMTANSNRVATTAPVSTSNTPLPASVMAADICPLCGQVATYQGPGEMGDGYYCPKCDVMYIADPTNHVKCYTTSADYNDDGDISQDELKFVDWN